MTFPFDLKPAQEMTDLAAVRGKQIVYLKTLETGQIASTALEGFGGAAPSANRRLTAILPWRNR